MPACCDPVDIDLNALCAILGTAPTVPNDGSILLFGKDGAGDCVFTAETPWVGIPGNGITITPGGVNGHNPGIAARLSTDAGNQASFGGDGGIFVPATGGIAPLNPVDTCSINLTASGPSNSTIQADVNTTVANLAAAGIACADTRGAPIFCSAGSGGLRTLPIPCQGVTFGQSAAGNLGGANPGPGGLFSPGGVFLPAFTNNGCYKASHSLLIRATFSVNIPAGNELQFQVEVNGVPQRFGRIIGPYNANHYEEYVLPELDILPPGGVMPARGILWHWILTAGLGAFIFNWDIFAAQGPYHSLPDC